MPDSIDINEETASPTHARFVAEPWESGFGHTIGNAMRRVILSSMEGCAVSTVRIDGVAHEFSSVPGVLEDVTEIILNLKKLRVSCDGDMPRLIELYADSAGPVTAAAILEDGIVQVLNPELVICTLTEDRPLRMELEVISGRGFRPAEENKREDHPIGVIPIDCVFSPVERVRYDVQACRVGNRTDFDRLELDVWTDGRITPAEAVGRAANLLRDHLAVFAISESAAGGTIIVLSAEEESLVEKLLQPISCLSLSVRAENCLSTANVHYLGELVEKEESEMLKFRNFGKKSLEEIKDKLCDHKLSLGMKLSEAASELLHKRLSDNTKED